MRTQRPIRSNVRDIKFDYPKALLDLFRKIRIHLKGLSRNCPRALRGRERSPSLLDHSSDALFLHCPHPLKNGPGPVSAAWRKAQQHFFEDQTLRAQYRWPKDVELLLCNNRPEKSLLERGLDHAGFSNFTVLCKDLREWTNWIHKISPLLRHLESGQCRTPYVLYLDADDTLMAQNPKVLLERFLKLNCSMLFANTHCDHPPHPIYKNFEQAKYRLSPGKRKHLSAGGFIAKKEFLIQCLQEIEEAWKIHADWCFVERRGVKIFDDQLAWRKLHRKYYPQIKVDSRATVFLRFDKHRHSIS